MDPAEEEKEKEGHKEKEDEKEKENEMEKEKNEKEKEEKEEKEEEEKKEEEQQQQEIIDKYSKDLELQSQINFEGVLFKDNDNFYLMDEEQLQQTKSTSVM